MDFTKIKPFLIKEKRSSINYILNLPQPTRKHNIFYISVLKKIDPQILLRIVLLLNDLDNKEYNIEEILDYQKIKGKIRYLVKWLNYNNIENIWELPSALNCSKKVTKYLE